MYDIRTCYICDDKIGMNDEFVQIEDVTVDHVFSRWICKKCRRELRAYLFTERYKHFS